MPATGTFPQVNSWCGKGVSSPEVAQVTRAFFQPKHPPKLMKKGEIFEGAGVAADVDHELVSTPLLGLRLLIVNF